MRKISVVIPTHNRLEDLKTSLISLLEQTELPDEIIVVDDGSQVAVPASIYNDFPKSIRTILLRNELSKGGNNARNRGVREATGDYIAFLDDDDFFKPKKIEELKKFINKNAHVDVVYHPAHIFMMNEKVSYITKPKSFIPTEDVLRELLVRNVVGGTPMVMVKRESLLRVGLFDESLPALQDYELWIRLAKAGCNFELLDLVLTECRYFSRKRSVSKSIVRNDEALTLIEKKYSSDYAKLSDSELKDYEEYKLRLKIHKYLLNGSTVGALKHQLQLFFLKPNIINLATLFVLISGPNVVFKLRAKLS